MTDIGSANELSIYIHWPFCEAKCPYCDFNSYVSNSVEHQDWEKAFLVELDRYRSEIGERQISSVFFGGGTPSLMKPELVQSVLNRISTHWSVSNDIEVTLEANPSSVETQKLRDFREAGINRVSLGLQALNDSDLRRLGRLHSAEEGLTALRIAQGLFDRVSFDLIYGRQNQTLVDWDRELLHALNIASNHISLYMLTIEPDTPFGALHRGGRLSGLPDEDLEADLFELTASRCAEFGFDRYEVSNHCRPGDRSVHNQVYWRSGDYLGIGPGAHGRITIDDVRYATETYLIPQKWLNSALKATGERARSPLTRSEWAQEYVLMGLRMTDGFSLSDLYEKTKHQIRVDILDDLVDEGAIEVSDDKIRVTDDQTRLLQSITFRLLED